MSDDDGFPPFPLAWHPRVSGDRPDPGRFTVPACAHGDIFRTGGGLWTSPMLGERYSVWSVYADKEDIGGQLSREGWALAWPDPARTARIDTLGDLQTLVDRFPCRAHRPLEHNGLCGVEMVSWEFGREAVGNPVGMHDSRLAPPLDFAAMSAQFDAVYLSEKGRQATWLTLPGTTIWSIETVLWLAPAWRLLRPITTDVFEPSAFTEHLCDAVQRLVPGGLPSADT